MYNATKHEVTLTWLLLNSQSTVDLIENPKMLVNIRKMRGEDSIRVHCNSEFNFVDRVGDLPGYGTVWYEPTGIANTLSMSRETKKFWVFLQRGQDYFQDGPPGQGSEILAEP